MKIIFDVDERYSSVMTFSFLGASTTGVEITTGAVDLTKGEYIFIDDNGKLTQKKSGDINGEAVRAYARSEV